MSKDEDTQYDFSPKVLIGADITFGFRGSGIIDSTSTDPDVVAPKNKNVPKITVSVGSYGDFAAALGNKEENSASVSNNATVLNAYNSMGAVGLDGLFVPYTNSVNPDTPFLPHFEAPTAAGTGVGTSLTLDPWNPWDQLNPFTSVRSHASSDEWYDSGHNISYVLVDNPYDAEINALQADDELRPLSFDPDEDNFVRGRVETSGVRAVGLRAPMILSGWGYDTDGNPVPASGDKIHPEFANPNYWKTGPVDFRWDNDRKVWAAGGGGGGSSTTFCLSKVTNLYNPSSFSFEVDRSLTRDQYTRNAPTARKAFNASDPIYDPEYVAYHANDENTGQYENVDYAGVEFPYYEAFIIRDNSDQINSSSYYNIWTEDCDDCGVVQNECAPSGSSTLGAHGGASANKKILLENPLRQALDVGDLCFTIPTGRTKTVNSGSFSGGSGVSASANLVVDGDGNGSIAVVSAGEGYSAGGFALLSGCNVCANVTLYFQETSPFGLASGTLDPSTGLQTTGTCPIQIVDASATADTESLPIHWIMQSEFKSQQVVTHAECSAGILQTCTMKIQTQGFKTCEHCGEDTAFINAY